MATVPAEVQGPSDTELLEEVRSGSSAAYAQLYERHVGAAYNMARQVAKSPAEADDLVSEAFTKVLDTLRDGRGPNTAFRAYLLTALRHTAYDRTRRERKVQLADDVAEVSGADVSVPFTDTAVAGLERTLAAQAFTRLPERWQTVLWHIEIEGQTPAQVAPLLGLTPNGVSALAYRAREGLRQAYLQVHLGQLDAAEAGVEQCRAAVDRLGAWTRGGLSKRETTQVETHLDGCDRCRALAAELADVNGALRVIIAPLVLGGSVTGYLALSSSGGAAAGAAVAAGSASGAAGAASAGPRQAVTAGAATAVLAAAVALALASGTDQSVPVAQAAPPHAAAQPPP
ncbi:sigma-70 family RNA polymerase sigma factor [Saccharopolyspora elongata]|uniref:sigma-70 family RNA polymerase sigma factor n=1 Tax=Saccharopolyspora elongata TaxID=2530387 RepID=UPI001F37332B|nr:sigma-70 family RNA polymerase sigma factor [Saccharopolyspora elongata]